jgi:hypothetical protein
MPQPASSFRNLGVEEQGPAVEFGVLAQDLRESGHVVADAGGAPHVGDGKPVAGIHRCQLVGQDGVEVLAVRKQGEVQWPIQTRLDVTLGEGVRGGKDHVVTAAPGE